MLTMGAIVFTTFNRPSIKIDMAGQFMLAAELAMFWITLDARSNSETDSLQPSCPVGCYPTPAW